MKAKHPTRRGATLADRCQHGQRERVACRLKPSVRRVRAEKEKGEETPRARRLARACVKPSRWRLPFFFFPRPTSRRRGRYDCTPPRPSSLHSCFLLQRAARREEKEIEKGVPGWWWWRWKGACGLRNKSCDSLHDNGNRAVHGAELGSSPRAVICDVCRAGTCR